MKKLSYLLLISVVLISKPIYAMETDKSNKIEIEIIYENKEIPGEFIAENETELNDFLEFHSQFPAFPMPTLKLKKEKSREPKKEEQSNSTQEDTISIYGYDIDKIMELSGAKFFLDPDQQRVLRIRELGERPKNEQEKRKKVLKHLLKNSELNG